MDADRLIYAVTWEYELRLLRAIRMQPKFLAVFGPHAGKLLRSRLAIELYTGFEQVLKARKSGVRTLGAITPQELVHTQAYEASDWKTEWKELWLESDGFVIGDPRHALALLDARVAILTLLQALDPEGVRSYLRW